MPISRSEFRAMTDEALAEWHRLVVKLEAADARAKDAVANLEREQQIVMVLKVELGAVICESRALIDFVRLIGFESVPDRFVAGLKRVLSEASETNDSAEKCLK